MTKQWPVKIWMIAWLIMTIIILFFTDGIGDNGDGLMHYLYAKYAHLHPENFLDPWAKTGFTLMAWPFAQLGLNGMKLMNVLSAFVCLILVYRICGLLQIDKKWSAVIILSLSTFYFKLMFSGLTEHLFSVVLIFAIYLLLKNKWILGTLILSTLPFFRQEGYIIMASLLPFYIWKHQWKMILLFPTCFLIIGLIGGFYYGDVRWIIRSNPYGFHQSYGKGSVFTFFDHLYYNLGLINLIFFVAGVVGLFIMLLRKPSTQTKEIFWLVFLPFLAFFAAHTVFWTFGIFHSMGLQRVLNCVTPLVAIIGALGFSALLKAFSSKWERGATILFTFVLIGFPFIPSPANINFAKDFTKNPFELQMEWACRFVGVKHYNDYLYSEHPLVPYYLKIDPFNKSKRSILMGTDPGSFQPPTIIFWENGMTQIQSGFSEQDLRSYPNLEESFDSQSADGKNKIVVFRVKK